MERWLTKLLALIVIFTVAIFFTLLPLKVLRIFEKWGSRGKTVLSGMMCFGGGVFFATYMLHMAPDAKELIDETLVKPRNITYPLGELLVSVGFFFMVFSENLTIRLYKRYQKKTLHEEVPAEDPDNIGRKLSKGTVGIQSVYPNFSIENRLNSMDNGLNVVMDGDCPGDVTEKQEVSSPHELELDMSGTRSLLLLLALSMHHMFEGLGVGLKDNNAAVWNLTIAILTHEVVISFSLGLQLVKAYKSKCMVIVAATMCSAMLPLGIAIGIALSETGRGHSPAIQITNGILQSLATGVFIYVTFFEILAVELCHTQPSLLKLVCMLLGFVTMALLALIPEDTDQIIEQIGNVTQDHA